MFAARHDWLMGDDALAPRNVRLGGRRHGCITPGGRLTAAMRLGWGPFDHACRIDAVVVTDQRTRPGRAPVAGGWMTGCHYQAGAQTSSSPAGLAPVECDMEEPNLNY